MDSNSIILVLHKIFAAFWVSMIPADMLFRGYIKEAKGKTGERKLISLWLKMLNLTGMAGLAGQLITGIFLISMSPSYGFFRMSGNHWLATKELVMIIIIILTALYFIPLGKKVRLSLGEDLESVQKMNENAYENIRKLSALAKITGLLVGLNYLLGITHLMFPQG